MANGPARHEPVPAWPDSQWASTARRASRAVPHRATGLAFGPGMALWADFRAKPAREARPFSQAVPARGPLSADTEREEGGEGRPGR